ncbi:MAG: autotransporter-associated beta strand repeat-containing protein [Verrucomicrobiota bacterium]
MKNSSKNQPFFPAFLTLSVGVAMTGIVTPSARAADANWTGTTSSDFNETTNWDLTPNGNNVFINVATGNYPILNANQTIGPVDILVGSGTGTGRFDHLSNAGGTGSGNWMFVGNGGSSNGTFNLADTAATGGTFTGCGQGSGSMDVGGLSNDGGRLIVGNGGSSTGTVNVNTSGTLEAKEGLGVLVGTNGGDGTLNLDGGTISTNQVWFGDNNAGSTGTLNMSGGLINATGNFIAGRNGGAGVVNMTGGTITGGAEVWFGEQIGANTGGGTGTVSNAGEINASSWLVVGRSGTNVNSSLTLNDTASISARNNGTFGNLEIAVFDSAGGTLNINGNSTVKLLSNADMILGAANTANTGTVNQNGGTVTFYSDAGTTAGGTGVLRIGAGSGFNDMSYYLNGGALNVNEVTRPGTTAFARFHFNGGILRANKDSATFFHDLVQANIRNGAAIIDTNGFNITVNQVLQHSPNGADYPLDGGLTKVGAGILTVVPASTYTGDTNVNGGTLILSANSDATFADTSTVRIVTGAVLELPNPGTDRVAGLVLGGVPRGLGTYDSTTPGGFITGNGVIQVVPLTGFTAWTVANAGGQASDLDHDNDGVRNGVEYFMGLTGSSFTANPGIVNNKVTWPKDPAFSGTYTVQTSPDLFTWTNVPSAVVGNTVEYTVPAGQGTFFVRLDVVPN